MGDRFRRWLVPGTPRRRAWQGLAYLLVIVVALTVAGIKYVTTSYPAHAPAVIATTPGTGFKDQGTKVPDGPQLLLPTSRSSARPENTLAPYRAVSPRPAATAVPGTPVTTAQAPSSSSPAPSPSEPSPSPSAPSASLSASPPVTPEVTPATTAPGGLRLTA